MEKCECFSGGETKGTTKQRNVLNQKMEIKQYEASALGPIKE